MHRVLGVVTNLVNQWKRALGLSPPDELRDLALTLKKVGITPAQCAVGFKAPSNDNEQDRNKGR